MKEFTFVDEIKERCGGLADEITKVNAVCVHVRLGDYLNMRAFCVTDTDYFSWAMKYIKDKVDSPVFYVFSDEPDKAKMLLQDQDNSIQYIPSAYNGAESMYLGTLCKHHILSNSSFSWWMQYLGKKEGQIVLAPNRWYNNSVVVDGLYQSHWVKYPKSVII